MDSDAFLGAVVHTIASNLQGTDRMLAARLGLLLRTRQGLDWAAFGYPRLSAVLADLQAAGRVVIDNDANGELAVGLPTTPTDVDHDGVAALHPTQRVTPHSVTSLPFRRLRPAVWNAFVTPLRGPDERRLIHRQSGVLWTEAEPPPGSDREQWIEVEPISESEQRNWATEFLRDSGLTEDNHFQHLLSSYRWFRPFRLALGEKNPILVPQFNAARSARVQLHVDAWCERNAVPLDIVFEPPRFPRPTRSASVRTGGEARSKPSQVAAEQEVRKLLLGVLARSPTTELLQLTVRLEDAVAVLRPDLMPA